jgi:hypothetical protein
MVTFSTGSTHSPLMNNLFESHYNVRCNSKDWTAYPVLIVAIPLKDGVSKVCVKVPGIILKIKEIVVACKQTPRTQVET